MQHSSTAAAQSRAARIHAAATQSRAASIQHSRVRECERGERRDRTLVDVDAPNVRVLEASQHKGQRHAVIIRREYRREYRRE